MAPTALGCAKHGPTPDERAEGECCGGHAGVSEASPEIILRRIDAIVRELQELQRPAMMSHMPDAPAESVVSQLAGALVPRHRPEGFSALDQYEMLSEWELFCR